MDVTLIRILVILLLLAGFAALVVFSVRTPPAKPLRRPSATPLHGGSAATGPDLPMQENLRLRSRLYYYAAYVTGVYDGDTVTVDIDLGMGIWQHDQTIRLWKINTPEVRGSEREQGLQVRDFVRDLILDKDILLRTILDKRGVDRTGKFGRLLGEILIEDGSGEVINVNELLLEQGMAVPMDESGSVVQTTQARGLADPPATIACPYCGETRLVDRTTAIVEICPNCLDQPYPLAQAIEAVQAF